ncbi:MAG: class I SAM-dependent methyltransferase [Parvibaculales bacterium]
MNDETHGNQVLDVGCGTGLSLPYFRPDLNVTGIDISDDMLARAEQRARRNKLNNIAALHVMDAGNMQFPTINLTACWPLSSCPLCPIRPKFWPKYRASPAPAVGFFCSTISAPMRKTIAYWHSPSAPWHRRRAKSASIPTSAAHSWISEPATSN